LLLGRALKFSSSPAPRKPSAEAPFEIFHEVGCTQWMACVAAWPDAGCFPCEFSTGLLPTRVVETGVCFRGPWIASLRSQ
jgi:hypothetical protein